VGSAAIPLFCFKKWAPRVDKTVMEEAREKPKILLLKSSLTDDPTGASAEAWARLSKALKTFTDLEERELDAAPTPLSGVGKFDHVFLDAALAPWKELRENAVPQLCLVQPSTFAWAEPAARAARLEVLASHPLLVFGDFSATDLVRVLHLYLMPKRLAGVTPLMSKGTTILGEKVMEPNAVGMLLDRVSTFLEKVDDFRLRARVPDFRQVLSALLIEGLRHAREKGVTYPFVDFQLAAAPEKLALNLRFPRGNLSLGKLRRDVLAGTSLFWHQIWLCSDYLLVTHHLAQDEFEVMALLCRPERNEVVNFRSFLTKEASGRQRRDDLLSAPGGFRFALISEITAKDIGDVELFDRDENFDETQLAELPEAIVQKIRQLNEVARVKTDHLRRKDQQVQELTVKNRQLTQDLNERRKEIIKLTQTREMNDETAEKKIRELELAVSRAPAESAPTPREKAAATSNQELVTRLEGMLRAAENEKSQLKEGTANEQRRASMLEQKYAQLYKDLAAREREITELRAAIGKFRKEAEKPSRLPAAEEKKDAIAKMRELEERDSTQRQDIKRLAYKIESQEKQLKVQQNEIAEKQKLFDQKLKAAKAKEVELLRRIEELSANLKKAGKAA